MNRRNIVRLLDRLEFDSIDRSFDFNNTNLGVAIIFGVIVSRDIFAAARLVESN